MSDDYKAGVQALLHALAALKQVPQHPDGSIRNTRMAGPALDVALEAVQAALSSLALMTPKGCA